MSITANLERISTAKENIKNKLIEKGVDVPANARLDEFPDMFDNIVAGDPGDWADIGYAAPPQYITNGIAYAKEIYDNWDINKTNQCDSFHNDKQLLFFPLVDMSNVTNIDEMFNKSSIVCCPALNITSKITSFRYLFNECSSLISVDCKNWDTSNVKNFTNIFYNCKNLKTLDVSNWNTSNATNIYNAFNGCSSLTTLGVSNWDISKITDLRSIFSGCSSLTTLDVSNWNTSNVTLLDGIFSGCSSLTTLDVSNWDISKITNLQSIFSNCSSLTTVDVNNWNTSNVTNIYYVFSGCSSLTTLDLSGWDTSKVTKINGLFNGCTSLTILDLSGWDTSKATTLDSMLYNCKNLKEIIGSISFKSLGNTYDSHLVGYVKNNSLRKSTFKDLGYNSSCTSAKLLYSLSVWGVDSDEVTDAKQSVIDTLITYSFDRATAGYSTCTVTLSANTKAVLTEDEIAQITAKGYTIA